MSSIRKTNFKFPEHWQPLKSLGAAHFNTQVIHRLPSGNLHIWSSKRFRKRRNTEIKSSENFGRTELHSDFAKGATRKLNPVKILGELNFIKNALNIGV